MTQYELHHGDCLDVMAGLPSASFDAIIADIPSGRTACAWDSVIPFEPMWAALKRVAKKHAPIVLLGCTQPFTSALVMSNVKMFRYEWVWDKKNSSGYLNANRRPMSRHESIVVFCDSEAPYYPVMRKGVLRTKGGMQTPSHVWGQHSSTKSRNDDYYPTSVIEISNANRAEKVHSTQKPLALLEYLVKTYTNEGDTVLDFTMGSGTTGAACGNLGWRFIGIERDKSYFTIAQERIATAYAPLRMMEAG
jgi:DNA modification methylase